MKEWCELNALGLAIRVFKNKKAAARYSLRNPSSHIRFMSKRTAVEQIRRQVFRRDDFTCVNCAMALVWESGSVNSAELDEVQPRGVCKEDEDGEFHSGEVSVQNGRTLCGNCHTGPGGKNDRSPSFTKSLGT